MDLIRISRYACLYGMYYFNRMTRQGAFGNDGAQYLDAASAAGSNPLKAALARHYVKQYTDAACSAASVVAVVNALGITENPEFATIRQEDILETVRTGHWKERMGKNGHQGRRGVPLPLLGRIVQSSLDAYRIGYLSVETVPVSKDPERVPALKKDLLRVLLGFEEMGSCLVIAHFDQGAYVRDLNIPHISPVGGFDRKTGRVTILDVDPYQAGPYRIGFDVFYRGMASNYYNLYRRFGYGSGGYVAVRLGRAGSKKNQNV